jgi:hypothetical protein
MQSARCAVFCWSRQNFGHQNGITPVVVDPRMHVVCSQKYIGGWCKVLMVGVQVRRFYTAAAATTLVGFLSQT